MRNKTFAIGGILLILAFSLFYLSYATMQSLYWATGIYGDWALYDSRYQGQYSLAGASFLASIILGIIGIPTTIYGATAKPKSKPQTL
jgi:hypothetical protein